MVESRRVGAGRLVVLGFYGGGSGSCEDDAGWTVRTGFWEDCKGEAGGGTVLDEGWLFGITLGALEVWLG